MKPKTRTVSLRTTLIALAVVGVVYVLLLVLEIVMVIAPAATGVRSHASDLLVEHDAIQVRLETMRANLASVSTVLHQLAPTHAVLDQERSEALASPIRAALDSVVAMRASLRLAVDPPEMRLHLAEAVQTETDAGLTTLEGIRAMRSGLPDTAAVALRRAEALLDSTALHLASAQGAAISSLLEREDALIRATTLVSRWAFGWAAVGALLLGIAVWQVRRRVYRPIAEIEDTVARVAGGDLTAHAQISRDDELGRLANHFNAMTEVLRERAAEQVRRHENIAERFGRILDQSSNEIYLFNASTLRFAQANRGALVNLGYTMEDLSALTPVDILGESHRESFLTALTMLRQGEQPSVVLAVSQVRKDGSVYPVEIKLQLSEASDPPVYVAVVDDLSERSRLREFNERLRQFAMAEHRAIGKGELEAGLHAITEMATDTLEVARTGVWAYHPDRLVCLDMFVRNQRQHSSGKEIHWHEQRTYIEALRTGNPLAAHDARHDPRTMELVREGSARPGVGAQLDIPVRAGGRLVAIVTCEVDAPRHWSVEEQAFAGSVADFVALAMEAAERSRLEEQLAKAQKMDSIGRLAGGVAHDFNNLLTAILGNVEFAQQSVLPGTPLREELDEIQKAAHRATDLTRQLLTFARHQVVRPRVVDLNALTHGADKLLRRLLGEDIELVTLLAPDLGSVRIDPGQFEQLIVNLAVNARDAMPNGGRLTIETANITLDTDYVATHANAVPGEYVQVAVSDTGHGMDRKTLSRLFEPFFTTKAEGRGTGLGLAICYGIVRQAGGNIWAYSEPGRGASFKVHLPKLDVPLDTANGGPAPAAVPRGRETILLVEDEDQIRDVAARGLRAQGYTVVTAANGAEAEAIARARFEEIDVLVTDIVLPLLGGRELAARLRADRPSLPVIFISGYTRGVVSDVELVGENTLFLSKPFTPSELARQVWDILHRTGLKNS
jgi:two-component system cell cycle sensor histidine kinase/response regulator CckA